ncbi:hypothetical protein ATCC90586_011417 [Pythium insidiosum]|nr:hypothetical protein ATCC90586_011417 [Pythium insidiosum]
MEEKAVENIKLRCGVYGEGSVFSVEIKRDADVEALQEAIVEKKKDVNHRFNVDPAKVTLYLAKKDDAWLKSDRKFETFLKNRRQDDSEYEKMIPNWTLDDEDYFGNDFQPSRKEIHVCLS